MANIDWGALFLGLSKGVIEGETLKHQKEELKLREKVLNDERIKNLALLQNAAVTPTPAAPETTYTPRPIGTLAPTIHPQIKQPMGKIPMPSEITAFSSAPSAPSAATTIPETTPKISPITIPGISATPGIPATKLTPEQQQAYLDTGKLGKGVERIPIEKAGKTFLYNSDTGEYTTINVPTGTTKNEFLKFNPPTPTKPVKESVADKKLTENINKTIGTLSQAQFQIKGKKEPTPIKTQEDAVIYARKFGGVDPSQVQQFIDLYPTKAEYEAEVKKEQAKPFVIGRAWAEKNVNERYRQDIMSKSTALSDISGKQTTIQSKHYIGEIINTPQGKYEVTGGDMNDPDVKLAK